MTEGVLYIASGKPFVKEAAVSAARLREFMPHTPVAIVTDVAGVKTAGTPFDQVIQADDSDRDFGDQIRYLEKTPFDRTLCLDTDIYLDAAVEDVFEVLDAFDIAAAHNQDGSAYEVSGVPDAFPEYNTGVVAYRMSHSFRAFLEEWRDYYAELTSGENSQNQPAFRKALYESELRVATLPSEYNTMVRYPGHAKGPVKMFHGRLLDINSPGAGKYIDVPKAAAIINSTEQHRTWTLLGGLQLHTDKRDSPLHKYRLRAQEHGIREATRRAISKIWSRTADDQ